MSTIYIPVIIETAEQAEALQEGTVVIGTRAGVIEKGTRGTWWTGLQQVPDRTALWGKALLPIEAEEETRVTPGALNAAAQQTLARANRAAATGMLPPDRLTIQQQTRLVTPWEPVEHGGALADCGDGA